LRTKQGSGWRGQQTGVFARTRSEGISRTRAPFHPGNLQVGHRGPHRLGRTPAGGGRGTDGQRPGGRDEAATLGRSSPSKITVGRKPGPPGHSSSVAGQQGDEGRAQPDERPDRPSAQRTCRWPARQGGSCGQGTGERLDRDSSPGRVGALAFVPAPAGTGAPNGRRSPAGRITTSVSFRATGVERKQDARVRGAEGWRARSGDPSQGPSDLLEGQRHIAGVGVDWSWLRAVDAVAGWQQRRPGCGFEHLARHCVIAGPPGAGAARRSCRLRSSRARGGGRNGRTGGLPLPAAEPSVTVVHLSPAGGPASASRCPLTHLTQAHTFSCNKVIGRHSCWPGRPYGEGGEKTCRPFYRDPQPDP